MSKKVEVKLFGSTGETTVTLPLGTGKGSISVPPNHDHNIHSRAVFACLRDLETRFETAGITESDYLAMVRSEFSVPSLSELSESMWARLSATLNACRRETDLFNRLVAKVRAHAAETVPVQDASPIVFAEPPDTFSDTCFVLRKHRKDGTQEVIYIGEFSESIRERCHAHADKTRDIIFLFHNGQPPEPFYPTLEVSPV